MNLLYRDEEREMLPLCRARTETDVFGRSLYAKTADADRQVLEAVAAARGVPRAQVALAWVLQQPDITSPILGATKLEVPANGTPIGLARLITRAEMRQPGTLARLFGPGAAFGSVAVSSLLGGIAGAVAVSAIAAPLLAGAARAPAAATPAGPPQAADTRAPGDAGSTLPGGDVAGAGPVDDSGFDVGLDDLFDV